MDVFNYVAQSNPFVARKIIDRFGYIANGDLGNNLRQLVNAVGEPAMEEIMMNHPDRDFFMEEASAYGNKTFSNACGCSSPKYSNADGSGNSEAIRSASQTNTFLLAAAIIIAAAIITKS